MASIEEKSMAEAAARPEAGEKEAFLEVLLKEEEDNDFPRAIPKEAKAKEREKDMVRKRFVSKTKILLAEEKILFQKFLVE